MSLLDLTPDALLTTTRSVRKRLDFSRPVATEVIQECLELAVQAPTGGNRQGWHFVIVTDAQQRQALGEIYRKGFTIYREQGAAESIRAKSRLTRERLEKILSQQGMEKRTPKTITTVPRLLKELEKVRQQGYAVDDEENNMGARCVGAPVFNQNGGIEASLGLSGTINQVNAQTMPRILEGLKDAARHVSMQLGYRGARRASGA